MLNISGWKIQNTWNLHGCIDFKPSPEADGCVGETGNDAPRVEARASCMRFWSVSCRIEVGAGDLTRMGGKVEENNCEILPHLEESKVKEENFRSRTEDYGLTNELGSQRWKWCDWSGKSLPKNSEPKRRGAYKEVGGNNISGCCGWSTGKVAGLLFDFCPLFFLGYYPLLLNPELKSFS